MGRSVESGPRESPLRKYAAEVKRHTKSLVGLAVFCLGVWLGVSVLRGPASSSQRQIEVLVFDSEKEENNPYKTFGQYLYRSLKRSLPGRVTSLPTVGSYDSLIRIDEASQQERTASVLALTQADVVYHYVEAGHPQFLEARKDSSIRSIAKLFHERLEFQAPKGFPSPRSAIASEAVLLRAKQICSGEEGSGTRVTVLNAKRVLNASWRELLSCRAAEKRQLIAALGIGFGKNESSSSLLGFTLSAARVLSKSVRTGVYDVVPLREGEDGTDSRYTVAWPALLVGDRNLDEQAIEAVLKAVRQLDAACVGATIDADAVATVAALNGQSDYCETQRSWRGAGARNAEMIIALHPHLMLERLDWLSRQVVWLTEASSLKLIVLMLLGACILASWIPGLGLALRQGSNRSVAQRITLLVVGTRWQWVTMLLFAALFHFTIGILVWLSELHAHALSSDTGYVEGGLRRAVSWTWYYVVMGGSNIELQSNLALFWVGILKAGWLVAGGALMLALGNSIQRAWRIFRMTERVLIVGWNQGGDTVVSELTRAQFEVVRYPSETHPDGTAAIDHVTSVMNLPPLGQAQAHSELKAFLDAELASARGVIVLGDPSRARMEGQGDTDLWVARQVRCIRQELTRMVAAQEEPRSGTRAHVRIVAEVEHSANIELIRALGADEAVCVRSFGTELLAQAVSKAGLCELLADLLRTDSDTHELYFDQVTPREVKEYRTFQHALRMLAVEAARKIPIGILRSHKGGVTPLLNPRGQDAKLQVGDHLICVSQRK